MNDSSSSLRWSFTILLLYIIPITLSVIAPRRLLIVFATSTSAPPLHSITAQPQALKPRLGTDVYAGWSTDSHGSCMNCIIGFPGNSRTLTLSSYNRTPGHQVSCTACALNDMYITSLGSIAFFCVRRSTSPYCRLFTTCADGVLYESNPDSGGYRW